MKVLIIDNGTNHLRKLKDLLAGNELEIRPLFQKYPPSGNYDLIILSGGSQVAIVNAPEIFKEEINLVKYSTKPIIGICEGCEIIAYTFDSKLVLNESRAKGIKRIDIIEKEYFDFKGPIEVYEAHQWAIKELGKDLIGIAKSGYGWEVIKHKDKPIYGFQFHPEMLVNETLGNTIFNQTVAKIIK
jgi:GMP synthase (glutamine-hydrolysing)